MILILNGGSPRPCLSTETNLSAQKTETEHHGAAGSGSDGSRAGGSCAVGPVFDGPGAADLCSVDSKCVWSGLYWFPVQSHS